MNKLFFWSITSALAGFIFGFDTVVISGAEQTIKEVWKLSSEMHGLLMGSALYGTIIGSLVGGTLADRFGRKTTLMWIGLSFVITAFGTAFAPEVWSFIIARIIGGLGIGVSTVAAPLYISEIAPPARRGRLAGMFQFNIVFGIIIAFASNALIKGMGPNDWRWMLGVVAIPAVIYCVMCRFIPESPRWLIGHRNERKQAAAIFREADPTLTEEEATRVTDAIADDFNRKTSDTVGNFWTSKHLRTPILLAFLIAFFNQLSGINAVLYFAPRIFEMAGLGKQAALLQSVGIGVTNLIFTFVGLWLIDRLGRKSLMYIGSIGYIISLGLVAWAFFTNHTSIVPVCIFAFIAAHAIGQGTVIWVFIAEIFPNDHRGTGQSLGSSTHWVFAALLATMFPVMVDHMAPGVIFSIFAGMMVLQLIWVATMMPETKGTSLEDMDRVIVH